jgi:hypothetical protein
MELITALITPMTATDPFGHWRRRTRNSSTEVLRGGAFAEQGQRVSFDVVSFRERNPLPVSEEGNFRGSGAISTTVEATRLWVDSS